MELLALATARCQRIDVGLEWGRGLPLGDYECLWDDRIVVGSRCLGLE